MKYLGHVVLSLAVLAAGCGASSDASDAGTPDITLASSDDNQNAFSASGGTQPASLTLAPLDADAVFGRLEPVETATGPCPWLIDETALGAIKTEKTFIRREVSNQACIWNYNSGFEISVRIESLENAEPVTERVYNFDNPPELRPQSGPGTNATLLLDTTWKEYDPRPYAYSFEQSDELVFIRTTGVEASLEGLRAVAEEIAGSRPGAPSIERQTHSILPAFDPCTVWTESEVAALIDADSHRSSRRSGHYCTYAVTPKSGTETIEVQTNFFEGDTTNFEKMAAKGFEDVSGFEVPALIKHEDYGRQKSTNLFALHPEGIVGVTVLGPDPDYDDLAEAYIKNLLQRLQ
ncbi:MAG: hypothetical protein AAF996_03160 [Pseudomonadota bacterium]